MKFKGLLKVALLLVAVSALFVACDTLEGGRFPHVEKVYMKPGEDWASDNPVYAAWMWTDGKEGSWTELTKSTIEEDLWEVAVPNEIDNIIFVKMEDGTTKDEFSWDTKEEQTGDLKVPYVFDNVQVYSISAEEWIALGAKEPEKPVIEAVAISATEFTSLKYAAQNSATDIELDGDKSFTFYADAKTYKFKYTDGTWDFTAITGEAITELDKEYPITKIGNTGYDNIVLKDLTPGAEYKVTLTRKDDGFAYVKVVATGNSQAVTPMIEEVNYVVSNHGNVQLTKEGNIATATITIQENPAWGGSSLEFGITSDENWSVKYTGATISELNKEYELEKGADKNNKLAKVKAGEEYKITVDCDNKTVKLERTKAVESSGEEDDDDEIIETEPKYYVAGTMNGWSATANEATCTFYDNGNAQFKIVSSFEGETKWLGYDDVKFEVTDANLLSKVDGGNIVIKSSDTENIEYTVTVTKKADGIYVKVVATGNKKPVEKMINVVNYICSNHGNVQLTKEGNIATATITIKDKSDWKDAPATELQFGITSDESWSVKYVGATISELNKEYSVKKDGSNNKLSNVKAGEEYKITVNCDNETVKIEKTKDAPVDDGSGDQGEEPVIPPETDEPDETKVYLIPNTNWKGDSARFAAYFYKGSVNTWVDMTDTDDDGIYECVVPEGYTNVIFCRMNPANSENDWGDGSSHKWNQTGDLTVPTDEKVLFTVPDGAWNDSDNTNWSTKQ